MQSLLKNTENKKLGLLDAALLVAGSMIGSGIFIVSSDMDRNLGSPGWLILIWMLTGLMTMIAALSYGELGAMFPKAGGQYIYLQQAYGKLTGFLYGWSFFAVIQTGTIAAVGVAFAKFTAYLLPVVGEEVILMHVWKLDISAAQLLAISMIVLLTYINTRGVRDTKLVQLIFTLAKLLSLTGLIVFGLLMLKPGVWNANWSSAWQIRGLQSAGGIMEYSLSSALGAVAASMVGSIFSCDA